MFIEHLDNVTTDKSNNKILAIHIITIIPLISDQKRSGTVKLWTQPIAARLKDFQCETPSQMTSS